MVWIAGVFALGEVIAWQRQTKQSQDWILALVVMGVLLFQKREQVRECLYFLRGSLFRPLMLGGFGCLIFCGGMMRVEQVTAQEKYVEQVFDGRQWKGFVEGIVETAEVNWEKMQGSLLIGACKIGTKGQEEGSGLVHIPMKGKITLDWDENFPKPGDFVRVTGNFSIPEKALNPGEMDYRSYCYVRHIGFSGFGNEGKIQQSVQKEQKEPVRWGQSLPVCARRMAYHVKLWAAEALDTCLEEKDAGVLKAVLLGDKSSLDMEEKTLYQTSGIAHLLAISGVKTLNLVSLRETEKPVNWAFLRLHKGKNYIIKRRF